MIRKSMTGLAAAALVLMEPLTALAPAKDNLGDASVQLTPTNNSTQSKETTKSSMPMGTFKKKTAKYKPEPYGSSKGALE